MWMSPMEILKLSIGLADFTCCQRDHLITTETQKVMNGGEVKKIPCDKPIAGGILEQLIDAKINHLFNAEGDMVMARLHCCFKYWWMRGLKEEKKIVSGSPDKIKTIYDTWTFSRDMRSNNPNWLLVNTLN